MHRKVFLAVLLAVFVFASAPLWAKPGEGEAAPNIRYRDLDGNDVWLHEEYENKIVVLVLIGGS